MEIPHVYVPPRDDDDGMPKTCQNQCPLSVITKSIPQFEELLELYYHCKLCNAPQAYLEAQTFVEHVIQCHAEYVPTFKDSCTTPMIACPESQTAAPLQTDQQEIATEKEETAVKDEDFLEKANGDAAKEEPGEQEIAAKKEETTIKDEDFLKIPNGDVANEEETGNIKSMESKMVTSEVLQPETDSAQAEYSEGIQPETESSQAEYQYTSSVTVAEIKGEAGEDIELVIEWPEGTDPELASQEQKMKMLEEITSKLVKQEFNQPNAIEEDTGGSHDLFYESPNRLDTVEHLPSGDHLSTNEWQDQMDDDLDVANDLEDEFSGHVAEQVAENVRYRLKDEVRQFFEAQRRGKLTEKKFKKSTIMPHVNDSHNHGIMNSPFSSDMTPLPSSQESDDVEKYAVMKQENKEQFIQRPGTSECWQCHRWYKPKHHPTCKRPHKSEKPSCDAYVCVADYAQTMYACRFCQRIFVYEDALFDHLVVHLPALNNKCDLCEKKFAHYGKLQAHVLRCTGDVAYKCPVCPDKIFNVKSNFTRHLALHGPKPRRFMCEFCGKGFSSKNSMIIHTRNHTGQKPYSCPQCDKSFKSQSHLIRHSYTHKEHKKYMCDVCGKSYVDKSGLLRHLPIHTEEGKPIESFPCHTCHKILRSKRQLEEHIKTYHSNLTSEELRRFECDICHKRYRTKRNLVIHKMIHSGTKPFKCDLCGKGFYKSSDVTIHRRIHTGEKPYKCEYCPRTFSNLSNHHKHRLIHTGERPFKCKFCTKSFNDPSHLTRHIKVHTGEKPFPCDTCDRAFATKQQLQSHALVHSAVQPFMCGVCGKTFRQKAKAKKHQCLWGTLAGQQRGAAIHETSVGFGDVSEGGLVVEEASEEFGEQIAIEQSSGDRLIVKVMREGEQPSEQIAVHMVDEHGQPISNHVAYQVVQHGGGGVQMAGAVHQEQLQEIHQQVPQA